jgi:hypothetical protein
VQATLMGELLLREPRCPPPPPDRFAQLPPSMLHTLDAAGDSLDNP